MNSVGRKLDIVPTVAGFGINFKQWSSTPVLVLTNVYPYLIRINPTVYDIVVRPNSIFPLLLAFIKGGLRVPFFKLCTSDYIVFHRKSFCRVDLPLSIVTLTGVCRYSEPNTKGTHQRAMASHSCPPK